MLVIEVQCCQNCQRHNWCSRHNQAKYHQFSSLLQSRLQVFHRHLSYKKNHPPAHYSKKTLFSNLGFPIQSYYDEVKKQIAVFPRHGAFQITVNGILIFSKLQSNIWPNIDKIVQLISEIKEQIDNGTDIKKYSIHYRLNNVLEDKDKQTVGKQKKSVKFKISKRPKSHQFNGSIYGLKANQDQTFQAPHQKTKNKDSNSKQKAKPQRRSEAAKKSLIKLKIKKNQSAHSINNQQSTHSINNNQQVLKIDQQFPYFARRIEGHQSSLMLNKRIQQKNEILRQVKSQQLKSISKGFIKLQKKSRKLVIQSNKASIKKEQLPIYECNDKVQQRDHNEKQIIFFKTKLKHEQPKEKKQDIQYQQQTYNEPSFERNVIEVEDYQSQKQINSIQSLKYMKDLKVEKEKDQFSNKKIDIILIEEDTASDYLIQIEIVKEYWEQKVEEIVQQIQKWIVQPFEAYKQVINEVQQQSFQGYSQNAIQQHKIQQLKQQQVYIPQKEKSENRIKCQSQSQQQIQSIPKHPITEYNHLDNQKQQIQQHQQQIQQHQQSIEQKYSQRSTKLLTNPPSLKMQDNLTQKPLQINDFGQSPQSLKQIQPSNVGQQKMPRDSFTLDEMVSEHSRNIEQILLKQQLKHFSQELANSILQNSRFLNEDNIKQVIQTLQQRQQNKFSLNQQINNSDENTRIAFQLTKEQGFFEGQKQSHPKSSFLQLKRLEERNKQDELEYSVYSEDPKERFVEDRESNQIQVDKVENEGYSNNTIVEVESKIDGTIVVEAGKEANQRSSAMPEQNIFQQKPASSEQLEDDPHQSNFNPQAEQQREQEQQILNPNSQLQNQSVTYPFNQISSGNKESPQKSIKSSKSVIQKQNQPSLRCLSSIDDHKLGQPERILPNTTETSISLSSQIRSQLNCIYYDIQARI